MGGFTGESWEVPLRRQGEDTSYLKGCRVGAITEGREGLRIKGEKKCTPGHGVTITAGCRGREDGVMGLLPRRYQLLSLKKWDPSETSVQRMSWFCCSVTMLSATKDQKDHSSEKNPVPGLREPSPVRRCTFIC